MATKIAVALEEDIDGGPAEGTVRFGLGGTAQCGEGTSGFVR
jgi:hypothetical protein